MKKQSYVCKVERSVLFVTRELNCSTKDQVEFSVLV